MTILSRLLFISFLAGAMSFTSCKDDPDPVPPDNMNNAPLIDISGFTFTDDQGQITTSEDPTDWQLDDVWQDIENELFESIPDLCAPNSDYSITVFPNPAPDGFSLVVTMPTGATYSLRLVDEDLTPIFTWDDVEDLGISFSDASSEVDTLRLYYQFIDPSNCAFRGHGDIIVQ